jgi:hypothetical protein
MARSHIPLLCAALRSDCVHDSRVHLTQSLERVCLGDRPELNCRCRRQPQRTPVHFLHFDPPPPPSKASGMQRTLGNSHRYDLMLGEVRGEQRQSQIPAVCNATYSIHVWNRSIELAFSAHDAITMLKICPWSILKLNYKTYQKINFDAVNKIMSIKGSKNVVIAHKFSTVQCIFMLFFSLWIFKCSCIIDGSYLFLR